MPREEQPDDGLTEQERAALNLKDEGEDDTTATTTEDEGQNVNQGEQQGESQASAADGGDAGDADAGADAADGAGDAQPAAAADEPQAQAPAPAAKADDVPAQPAAAQAPLLIVEAPEDAEGKLAKIADDKKAILQKYEDGELTGAEMQSQVDALNEQALEIKLAVREAALAQKMEQQRLKSLWEADCTSFLKSHPEYKDETRGKLLDEYLLALSKVPSNNALTNEEALVKAHKMVKVHLGEPVDDPKPQPQAQDKPAKVEIPKPAAQPNIGNLPAASMNDTTGGEFAALDRLQKSGDLEAYEDAVGRLTDAQRARYLRA